MGRRRAHAGDARHERQHGSGQEDQRDPGQRDRDRLLYTSAFRRLAGVTQVVGPLEGHVFHNRLTHTLEVAQVTRRLAEKLAKEYPIEVAAWGGLDPDVAEAAALAHDLGHPPFGHIAEQELDALATHAGAPDGFEGNAQSFRIVTRLAVHRAAYDGLNLTRATLNAVLKYPWRRDIANANPKRHKKYGVYESDVAAFEWARRAWKFGDAQSLEAAVMDQADAIAYSVHDADDFFRAGLLPIDSLKQEDAFRRFLTRWADNPSGGLAKAEILDSGDVLRRALGDIFLLDEPYRGTPEHRAALRTMTSSLIQRYVYAVRVTAPSVNGSPLVVDADVQLQIRFLQRLIWDFVIYNPRLATQQHGQRQIIRSLFDTYLRAVKRRDDSLVPATFREQLRALGAAPHEPRDGRAAGPDEVRLAVDVVASFNDQQAVLMYRRLMGVAPGSIADSLGG